MNSNIKTRHTASAACFLTVLACALFSSAFADEPVRSETVKFQDVNVGSPAGIEVLYHRIHGAAQRVCSVSGEGDLARAISSVTCAREAEAGAIKEVNLPALTAYYKTKTGAGRETLAANQ